MTIAAESFYKTRNAKLHRSPRFALRPIACCVLLACEAAWANPTGPQVVNGAVSFARPDARTLGITNTPGSIINWQGFSIGAGEITRFTQQSSLSAVLNRVVGPDISRLQGQLLSNGRVYLINPAGIVVGAGAVIDTAGFVGSTLQMLDADFLAGKLKFDGAGGGVLRNEGTIRASGDIYLVGQTIENAGLIRSDAGNVVLAAGRSVTIASPELEGVQFKLQAPTDTAINLGTIEAKNAASMFAGTLRHSGDIRAGGMGTDSAGRIVLYAQKDATVDSGSTLVASGAQGGSITVQSGGTTLVAGSLDATGTAGKGGTVHLLGERVGVTDSAVVNASGDAGGGTILVGGDYQGGNAAIANAQATYFGPDATLRADAIAAGDGGKVIVWSDGATRAYGVISARGGAQSGDGGFIETSGHYLDVTRAPDTGAPAGRGGLWLLDPGEVTIAVGGADTNIAGSPNFTPAPANAVSRLTVATLNAAIVGNTNVSVSTGVTAGGASGDILFDASAASGGAIVITRPAFTNDSFLTLNAARDIRFLGGATTFRTTAGQSLFVELNPGQSLAGGVFTNAGATVNVQEAGGAGAAVVNARVLGGKTWTNNGTININPRGAIQLHNNVGGGGALAATMVNNSTINVSESANPAFFSDAAFSGVLNNDGTLNVTASGQFNVELNQGTTGSLNISNASTLTPLNVGTIQGTIDLGAGSELRLSQASAAGAVFDGTNINGTGTFRVQGDAGQFPQATFQGVAAPTAALIVGQNGTAIFNTASSSFGSASVEVPGTVGPNPGVLTVNGTGNLAIDTGTVTVQNGATVNVDDTASVTLLNGATVNNSGAWSLTSTNATPFINGGGTFNNAANGTFTKAAAATQTIQPAFNNSGTVNVNDGTLTLGVQTGNDLGTYAVGGSAHLVFNAARTLAAASTVNGAGNVHFSNGNVNVNGTYAVTTTTIEGGTALFNAVPTLTDLTLSSGTLSGTAAVTVPGTFAGSGGTITVFSGAPAFSTTNQANVTGAVTLNGRTWNNAGVVSETGAAKLTLAGNAIINNQPGRAWNVDGTDPIAITGAGTFNNAGTFTKSGTTEQTVSPTNFTNTHLVDIAAGPSGGLFINATGTHAGDFGIAVNHFLEFSGGAATFAAGSTISGGGGVRFTGGTHTGPVSISNLGAFGVLGGSLTIDPAGTFDNVGASFVTSGTFNMNAAAVPANTGLLTVSGGAANFGAPLSINGPLTITSGATTFNAATTVAGNLLMNNAALNDGTLASNGTLTLNGPGNTWTAGAISGNGLLVTGAAAGTTIDGTVILHDKRWDNFGTVTMSGSARLVFEGNGGTPVTFTNKLGGTVVDTSTNDTPLAFSTIQTNKLFVNEGTFTKDVGSFGTQMINVAVNNSKTLNVSDGTLQLINGGTDTGIFAVSGGAVLEFGGGVHALNAGSSITGTGTVRISGGELDVNTPMTLANPVVLTGGGNVTLGGTSDVTLTGPFTWNQGADIRGAGLLTTTGTTTMSNAQDGVDKNWTNTGTVNMDSTAGIDFFVGASTITNNNTFNVASTLPNPFSVFSGSGAFVNNGAFNKTGAGTQTIQSVTFTNGANGNLNVSNGTLVIASLSANPGTITLSNNAVLSTNGGALDNTGTIGGAGTLDVGASTVTNNGTLRPGPTHGDTTDTLAITGNLTQGLNGQVNIELGGTAPGDFDVLAVSNTATLAGTMNVSTANGYVPVNGNSFTVLTAGARTGLFSAVNQSFAGALTAVYDSTSLMFTIGGAGSDTWLADTGSWNVPGNWSLGHVPGPGEAAIINRPGGPFTVTLPAGTYQPDSLTSQENIAILGGATLNLASASTIDAQLAINGGALGGTGPLTVNGSLNFNGGQILNLGGLTVTGTSNLSTGAMQLNGPLTTGLLNLTSGTLVIGSNGTLNVNGAGASVVDSAILTNGGTLGVTGGGTLAVHANSTFTNPGRINVQNGTMQVNGGFPTNPGTIMVGPGATFSTNGNALTNANTGLIGGNGTIDLNGQTLTNNGTVAPGASPGTLTINGNYTQLPGGTLAIELAGTQQGMTYDLMQVNGVANLNGTLSVTPINGFVPQPGNTFTFMTYNSHVGDFTTFQAPGGLLAAPGATAYGVQLPNAGTGGGHLAQDETQRLNDQLVTVLQNQQIEEKPDRTGQICR